MKKALLAALALGALIFAGNVITAHALTINYNTVLTGDVPIGSPPWLTATFTDKKQTVGTSTLSGVLLTVNATGLAGQEFTTDMLFNSTLASLSGLRYINNSDTVTTIIGFEAGNNSVIGAAGGHNNLYDLGILFSNKGNNSGAARLTDNEIANIFLYGVTGLNADTFNAGSFTEGFISQAHIQDTIGPQGSSWVVEGSDNGTPVPEPGTMVLLGIGLFGLAVYSKRRMNR